MAADSLSDLLAYFRPPDIPDGSQLAIGLTRTFGSQARGNQAVRPDNPDQARVFLLGAPHARYTQTIRDQLYRMGGITDNEDFYDLGDFRDGKTTADTLAGWTDVLFELGKRQKILIVLGHHSEGMSHTLNALNRLEHPVNLSVVSPDIHLVNDRAEADATYLNRLLTDPESQLFDYVHLAYQTYFCDPGVTELLDRLYFSHIRLGELRSDLREAEPHLRNSDMLAFSLAAVRHADAPGTRLASANGLYAEEACQLVRYAGLSDRLYILHLTDLPDDAPEPVTANLTAQLIWHFVQALHQRKKDYPFTPISAYSKYIVSIPGTGHEVHFYRNPDGERWWLEVPFPDPSRARSLYIACTEKDYHLACSGEIPERWLKNYQRIS